MSAAKTEETAEQFGKRAADLYERVVKPKLKAEDDGKFVAVDANTGEFEVDEDDYLVVESLLARLPDADIWLKRAGHPTAYEHFGVRSFEE